MLIFLFFFVTFISLEELDDFSDSGSEFEPTTKATKPRKKSLPANPV